MSFVQNVKTSKKWTHSNVYPVKNGPDMPKCGSAMLKNAFRTILLHFFKNALAD
jgi:hypothetical protein